MKQEIEAKFLQINLEDVRARLAAAGATLVMAMADLKRALLETPEMRAKDAFIRVRDEGEGKLTATYKQHASATLGGANEIELVIDDFEAAVKLFEAIGLKYKSYQETKREVWSLKGAIVTLDLWPWLDPLVEIEADSGETVKAAATALQFAWGDAVFGGIMVAYRHQYPHLDPKASIGDIRTVTFDAPLPTTLKP
jgi:predicted adenylyl cyclase CyaB